MSISILILLVGPVSAIREYKVQYDFSFCKEWWVDSNYTFCAEGKKILLSKETINDNEAIYSTNYFLIQRISLYLGDELVYESKGRDINLGIGIAKCADAECDYFDMIKSLERGLGWDGETFSPYFYIYVNAMRNVGHSIEKIEGEKPIIYHDVLNN